tara:strand:- start:520 stop:1050 length:531 start_codon:yes stop_codon:yes gene_type:complete
MDDFNTIRLKKKTIDKFKKYSKKISPSYSETLDFMIAFFEDNDLSPYDILNENMTSVTNRINKRIDAVIAIFRNVEQTQLKPTRELLESLFANEKDKKPLLVERKRLRMSGQKIKNKELDFYRENYEKSNKKYHDLKHSFNALLKHTSFVNNSFGSNYYRININQETFEEITSKLP